MNRFLFLLLRLLLACSFALAAEEKVRSVWAASDQPFDTDLNSSFWRGAVATYMDSDPHGKQDAKYRPRFAHAGRRQNLYFLFIRPYEELYLKPEYFGRNQ